MSKTLVATFTLATIIIFNSHLVSQEIVVDPHQLGASDVVSFDPITSLTYPLPDPIVNPLDLNDHSLYVGNTSEGDLLVSGGASVSALDAVIGVEQSGSGTLTLEGSDSSLETRFLEVGRSGSGRLQVRSGAIVDAISMLVATQDTDASGHVEISDTGTTVNIGLLNLGDDSTPGNDSPENAIVTVSEGAELNVDFVSIQNPKFGESILTVTGAGTRFAAMSPATSLLRDTLKVLDGAAAEISGNLNAFGEVDGFEAEGAVIVVDGSDSMLTVGGSLEIGSSIDDVKGRMLVTNGARVEGDIVSVGRTSPFGNTDSGRVILSAGGTLHVADVFNQVPNSVMFAGGTLSLGGNRTYSGGVATTGFDTILYERGGVLTNDETLQVEGNLAADAPITIIEATLSAGSITGMSNINLLQGRLELTDMELDVSTSSDFGNYLSLLDEQELSIAQGINVAPNSLVELEGGIVETSTFWNEGTLALIGGEFSQLVGDLEMRPGSLLQAGIQPDGPGQLGVYGQADLNGELTVELPDGFSPLPSSEYIVLFAGQLSGQFNNVASGERLNFATGSFLVHYGSGSPYGNNQIVLSDFQDGGMIGDVNGDGEVNLLDVAPFIDALTSGSFLAAADINQDGMVNLLDVEPFINLLTN